MQFVQVKIAGGPATAYTYLWEGDEPLEKGDWVVLPPNMVNPKQGKGIVVALDSDYEGRLASIVQKIPCTCESHGKCLYHQTKG